MSADVKVCDAIDTGYPDDYFDAVIDNVSIYANTIDNIRIMYEDIFRMLKCGGELFTTAFTADTFGADSGVKIE